MIELRDDPLDPGAQLGAAYRGEEGGVVSFVGTVRSATRGRAVLRLEYEAYREMALAELERIAREAREKFAIRQIDVQHRLGTLLPGDVAVAIVVRAEHRAAAFDACRFAIDEIKRTVPIWKKEVFADGEVWVGDRP